ncbi:PREDICTED: zinc finger protein PLAGL1 [Dipodomys ordii]|uniref:Zinc finger protein PLAGL1 n=1 Tax=Dipodomys ordii TaxID=10020 RepID=A0A1S3G0T6_DIPOR|nr:PREDICTED: zinc finger protein PLAGL1 [Dipodomys ordii]
MAPFHCQICGKNFLTLEKFTIHNYSHSRERPFKCAQDECGKAFVSKYKLMRHMATHSPQKSHRCAHCEKTFNRKDHLKNHLQTHDPNKMSYGCEECGKKYTTVLGYKRHVALHAAHNGDLTCGVCALELGSTEVLMSHLKTHSEEKPPSAAREKKHRCDHCARSFYTRKDVRRHLVVHTGCKDFLCQFCAQRFGRKDHLTRHTKKTHSQELMRESLQAGELLNPFPAAAAAAVVPPPFQFKAPPMAPPPPPPPPFAVGPTPHGGLLGSLPADLQGLTLGPPEPILQPMPPMPEPLAPMHPMVAPGSPALTLQGPKYELGATCYPAPPLAGLPLKADPKGFCNMGVYDELPLQEPLSPHKLNQGFELVKIEPGMLSLPKELQVDALSMAIPASLEISPLLGFWQVPSPPSPTGFGNNFVPMGPGEPLPRASGPPQQQQQLLPPPIAVGTAMGTVSLSQLPLPPMPYVFTTGPSTAILPHFHHAFR